jgi:hypothetical protein
MQGGDHLSPVADRRCHPLDRTRTHVTDRKDARHAGFGRILDIAAGANKTLVVKGDAGAGQPVGVRLRADEQKQVPDRAGPLVAESPSGSGSFEDAVLTPSSAETDVWFRISIFGVAVIRLTR